MATAHHRRKQPELIRRSLLDCAAKLALEQGLAAVTVQAVSAAAGVTKGGFFHHFPSKDALIEGVAADLIAKADQEIDALMAKDPEPRGAFTRAYVACVFSDVAHNQGGHWAALQISLLAEPKLRQQWSDWSARRVSRHHDTDGGITMTIARLAADGVWLASLSREAGRLDPDPSVFDQLIAMTRPMR